MKNLRLLAPVALIALAAVGAILWSNRSRTSASQAVETLGSGVTQATRGTREVELESPVPSREPIEQPGKAHEPDTTDTPDPVLTKEEEWLARYSAMDSQSLFQISRDKQKEYIAFHSEEVERYIASGMATSVPLDKITVEASPERDTISVGTVDRYGDGYTLFLERSESPDLFEVRDESEWLRHYVMGTDPYGNSLQDNIRIRRGEPKSD